MNARTLFFALAALTVAFCPVAAPAQTVDAGAVREFIERNGELLDAAAALVQETNSTKARASLETARTLHAQSISLLDSNSPGLAARVAFRTREVIQQTIALAKREARIEEQALKAIERAAFRLEQARTAFEEVGSGDPAARRLIMESADNLRRAREQLQQHTFEVSLKLAESSLALSTRALRLLRRDAVAADDLDDELERTEQVLQRLADARPTLPRAIVPLADRAVELQRQARAGAVNGTVLVAREQTLAARGLALRALRTASGGDAGVDGVERAVFTTDEILERAREIAAERGDRVLAERVAEATRAQETARRALERSELEPALHHTMRARQLVRNALGDTGEKVDPTLAEDALGRTDELIARLQQAATEQTHTDARALLERARSRQAEARNALQDGDARRALALTKVANNLAREGLRLLGDAAF